MVPQSQSVPRFINGGATTVAIKQSNSESKQGAVEFWTEIKMLSKVRHTHHATLIGYSDDCEEMILVYEHIANGMLVDHLYKNSKKGNGNDIFHLTWEERLKICIGAVHGLDYLHMNTEKEIQAATNNFHEILGIGLRGDIEAYRGHVSCGNLDVAIKSSVFGIELLFIENIEHVALLDDGFGLIYCNSFCFHLILKCQNLVGLVCSAFVSQMVPLPEKTTLKRCLWPLLAKRSKVAFGF
ncbi:hypothetical protein ACSBR1_025476 [Camellia fascicularis]